MTGAAVAGIRRRLALLLVPVLLATGGCATDRSAEPGGSRTSAPVPFADCAGLTVAPSAASAISGQEDPAADRLPDLSLPCFADDSPVSLREIRGPAVINIWASWCPPCRRELPAFQRLAERSEGRLHVIGVNSRDSRDAAAALGADFGLTFPTLADAEERLLRKLGRNALPLTLFVDGQGRIRHVEASGALTDDALVTLLERHLGVVLP